MPRMITQSKLRARTLGVEEDLMTALDQIVGVDKTLEAWNQELAESEFTTMTELMEAYLMPADGIIGMHD